MPQSGRFKAWVQVNGQPLPEYKVETDNNGSLTCWIASEEGKNFEVHWSDDFDEEDEDEGDAFQVCMSIDGQRITKTNGSGHGRIRTMNVGPTTKALLTFGKVVLTEDESEGAEDATRARDIGSIEVRFRSGMFVYAPPRRPTKKNRPEKANKPEPAVLDIKPVPEKLKKAGCHRVVPGELIQRAPKRGVPDDANDPRPTFRFGDSPWISIVFYYRTKEFLQAADIIREDTRDPRISPEPSINAGSSQSQPEAVPNSSSSSEDEDESQIESLQSQLSAIKERMQKRKAEGTAGRSPKKPKVEASNSGSLFEPGEIIDLT